MADVQLGKGYLRVANALNRALIVARFSDVQRRIVQLLLDQTFGWQRKTVEKSTSELAAMLDVPVSGGFRAALAELVDNGVVVLVRPGSGRQRSVFAVQKDHERWGRFAVASALLASRFGQRPRHADTLLGLGDDDSDPAGDDAQPDSEREHGEGAYTGAPSPASEGALPQASSNKHAPTEAPRVPARSKLGCLHTGTLDSSKSFSGESCERGKTGKTEELQQQRQPRANAEAAIAAGTTVVAASPIVGVFDPTTYPRWPELSELLVTDHNRGHVITFLETCELAERSGFIARFANWLQKLDCPPTAAPSPDELATGLSEYKGDRSARHVWSFVEDCVRRYRSAGSGRVNLSGATLGRRRSGPTDIERTATRLWDLIKRNGLASCPPELVAGRVDRMLAAGEIRDGPEFRAYLARLPLDRLAVEQKDFFAIQTIVVALTPDPSALTASNPADQPENANADRIPIAS